MVLEKKDIYKTGEVTRKSLNDDDSVTKIKKERKALITTNATKLQRSHVSVPIK